MVCYSNLLKKQKKYCKPVFVESNEPLFLLYTSGTTGKPKGIVHDTGGYLTQAYTTTKWNFDVHGNDVMWCTADIGWITGHTYGCYGPLLNGITTLMYEGAPTYPDEGRWFDIIDKHKVTQFYTAPTAIRMLEQKEKIIKKYNLSSLRLIASVGEPIDEEAWLWYFNKIGKNNHPLIDTWWQTETGGNLINALPGIGPFIPTVAGKSFPGTRHKVLDEEGKEIIDKEGFLVQESPFAPGMLRGVYNNPEKYKEEYWSKFKGKYFTGDKAIMDKNGNIRILGRGDDVMKVAGHRLATAEVENAVDSLDFVEECAVVPKKDRIKGQVPAVFAISEEKGKKAKEKIINAVLKHIGPTAKPKAIYFVGDLPKTRSGKIMRRLIKNVMENKKIRDKSTLKNPDSLNNIKGVVGKN